MCHALLKVDRKRHVSHGIRRSNSSHCLEPNTANSFLVYHRGVKDNKRKEGKNPLFHLDTSFMTITNIALRSTIDLFHSIIKVLSIV